MPYLWWKAANKRDPNTRLLPHSPCIKSCLQPCVSKRLWSYSLGVHSSLAPIRLWEECLLLSLAALSSLRCSHWEKIPMFNEACPVFADGGWKCPCWKLLSSDTALWTESFGLCMVSVCITEVAYRALHSVLAVVLLQFSPLCVLCTKTQVTQHQLVLTWASSVIYTVELQICCFRFYCGVKHSYGLIFFLIS